MATGYKAENAYTHSIFATTDADVRSNYVFSPYEYGYYGDLHNYVKSVSGRCWGLAPFSGYELRCAQYYRKNGVNVPFATRASSTVPTPNADGATSSWDPAPFKAVFGIMRSDPEAYVNIKWDSTTSKCLISYLGYQYVDADGVWLFMQAPGGGGGGTDYATLFHTGGYAGCGGGSGSSALVYLACRLLYRERGSGAYFRVKIGKPGAGGSINTDGSSGTDGGNVELQIVYDGNVEEPLTLGGGGGGGLGYWNAAGSKGSAGSVLKNSSSAYVWVVGSWPGASGSSGVYASGLSTERADSGDNLASSSSYLPMNGDKYLLMRTQYDSSGNGYKFGYGSHSSWGFGGGGGGSACARVAYSTSYPDSVISAGIGGCGGQTLGNHNGTDGGEGCVYVLTAPVQTEAATRPLAAPELYYSKSSSGVSTRYQVLAVNDNNACVTCKYWLYDSTTSFFPVMSVEIPAKSSATLSYSFGVVTYEDWAAGSIVKAQFQFDGELSSTTSVTLPSSSVGPTPAT